MRRFLGVTLVSAMALVLSPVHALEQPGGQSRALERFSARLQTVLNSGSPTAFETVVSSELLPVLAQRLERFRQDFPEVMWQVEPAESTPDGRPTLNLRVRGATESEGLTYSLDATEQIAIRLEAGQLVEQELLAQQSLLRSGKRPLSVNLAIPDVVLTGSRYDIDLVVEEPLGKALVAGGLIDLTDAQLTAQFRPNLPLAPLGGGGLFKSVQAPQQPGSQTWAVMLVHPDGVVTATKRVRVVSSN
ncbi:hypothetical protein [Synechococcus sp. KORDI-52]|uniref:hypothetical protein n=1 Tax=Synechococcus sp. KORDI-52 TaxID=585425 RepID=UPI0005713C12|nr:hypothetical protein [Synechococcus sp. KORDI-52]